MIHKKLLLALLASATLHAQEYPHFVPVNELFTSPHLALSIRQQNQVQELLQTINKSSIHQQIEAAQEAAHVLKKEIERRRLIHEAADEQDKDFIGYKAGILISQAHWLEHIAKKMKGCLPIHKRASHFCKRYFKRFQRKTAQLFNSPYSNLSLTDQLLAYAQLEREHIFSTYPSTVALAVIHEHKDLPELMAFWSSHRKQWLLLNESKKYLYQPRVQAGLGEDAIVDAASAAIEAATQAAINSVGEEAGSGASDLADGAVSGDSDAEIEAAEKAIIEASAQANEEAAALGDTEEIQSLLSRTAEKLQGAWSKAADTADTIWGYVPGHSIIDKVVEVGMKLATGPMKFLWGLAGKFLPDAVDITDLAASMSEGALTAADATPEALEQAGNTVEEFAAQGKTLSSRLAKKGFGRLFSKAVTEDELTQLSASATEDDLAGALRTQIAQARSEAAETLESGASRKVMQRALRKIAKGKAAELSEGANALRLGEAGLGGTGVLTKDTTELLQEVKALQEELMTPLTKSGRYLRMFGNMNRALAANYPMVHMALEMTFFMDMMMGGQLAISWENQAQAKQYIAMTQQRNKIGSDFQSVLSQIEVTKEASLRQLRANKAKMLLDIAKINQQLSTSTVQEINYIVQSIAGHTPQHIYLSEPMMYDQYFYYSPMLTPNAEAPLFPSQNENSPWVVRPTKSPILKQLTAGWIVEQNSSNEPTAPGTGAWVVGEKSPEEPPKPIVFTQQFDIPEQFPTNPVAHTWYNPFRAGNWIFNPDENAFIQYLMQPITSTTDPQGGAAQALQNSIFTEYIPPIILNKNGIMTYVVQVEMQLYNAQFPFFAGIFFNGGRWISGSTDLRKQHRLFGLYGSPDKKISIYATETAYISDKNQLLEKTSLTALEQVFATPATRKEWAGKYRALIPNPLYPNAKENSTTLEVGKTYILTAATQPTRIMVTVEEKTDQGTIPVFGPYTIINRNPFVFIYHNIGFVSGGCSAGFRIIKPEQLAYTPEMLNKFKTEIGLSEPREPEPREMGRP